MNKLTGIIIAKNEEKNIEKCLESIKFCDELMVVDDFSNDSTVKIAKSLGATVVKRKMNKDFAGQRNFALNKAKGDWILFIDADERVSSDLKKEILMVKKRKDINGVYFRRHDYFMGKLLRFGELGSTRLLRMARKGSGEWRREIHEHWNVEGAKITLINPILHYSHPTLSGFIQEINWMSDIHAMENQKENKRSSIAKVIIMPKIKFFQNYIVRLGFLDGIRGFVFTIFMSFHSFLSWSKLWLLQKSEDRRT